MPDKDLVDLCPPIEPYQVTKNHNRPYTKTELNREKWKPILSRENKVAVKLLSNLNVLNWIFYGDIPNGDYSRSCVMEKSVSHGFCGTLE